MSRPDMTPDEMESVAQQIVAMTDYSRMLFQEKPKRGQFLVTAAQQGCRDALCKLGFCVQVRLAAGQYGSDIVFMRHAAGNLMTHENQSFFPMSPAQEALARGLFRHLPEDEDYSLGFKCADGVREFGHLVEASSSRPATGGHGVVVTTRSGDGSTTSTALI